VIESVFKTEICDLLEIKYPIIQGGMAWVSTAELAAAVSNVGGLGIIGAGQMPAEKLRQEVAKARSLTTKPFGVNLMLLASNVEELVKVILEEEVPVVTTGAGSPGAFLNSFKRKGIKVLPVVPSVALAQRMERAGADAVIVEGTEAGGHIGELTTLVLVPQVVDAVSIPVIAAGGIADGRGFIAALALGAKGVQMGTRFICTTECTVHENFKQRIVRAKDRDTVVTGRSTGHPVRCLKNKLTREFERLEKEGASIEELERLGTGKLRRAALEGDMEFGSVMAGQCAGLVKSVKSVAEVMLEIVEEARKVLKDLERLA
jgi:enoyl-[acyl-carrier protein] reductase II